jgi:hypothetical protein
MTVHRAKVGKALSPTSPTGAPMSKESTPARANGPAGSRVLSAVLVAVGAALVGSALLMVRHLDAFGVVAFSMIAVATLSSGLVLARRSALFTGWSWSGRTWSEVLTPGGPVRSPFEWIRVGIATSLGATLLLVVSAALLAGVRRLTGGSVVQTLAASDASFSGGIAAAGGILAMLLGLAAFLLGVFAVLSLVVGVIGLGLRSGASSMSLRDWVSMDKRT